MLISKTLPSILGGVSQQDPTLRLATQLSEMVNANPDLVRGLMKRNGTEWLQSVSPRKVGIEADPNAMYHFWFKNDNEQYLIVIQGYEPDTRPNPIRVFNLAYDGVEIDIAYGEPKETKTGWVLGFPTNLATGNAYSGEAFKSIVKGYFTADTAFEQFGISTMGDTTIIANRTIPTRMSEHGTAPGSDHVGVVWVKSVVAGGTFKVCFGDRLGAIVPGNTTPLDNAQGFWKSGVVASLLGEGAYQAGAGGYPNTMGNPGEWGAHEWYVSANGSILYVTNADDLNVSDSIGNVGMSCFYGKVQKLSDLPPTLPRDACQGSYLDRVNSDQIMGYTTGSDPYNPDGMVVEVTGDDSQNFRSYFLRYETEGGSGSWVECVKPGLPTQFDPETMPHIIKRFNKITISGTLAPSTGPKGNFIPTNICFYITTPTWAARKAGDNQTNPRPSFIGRRITSPFFYKGRLGFLASDNVIFSRAGEFFNFWGTTATEVTEDDPIDIAMAHENVSNLVAAVPYGEDLFLLSRTAQYILSSGDNAFSSKSVSVNPCTTYLAKTGARAVSTGSSILFLEHRNDMTALRELMVIPDTSNFEAEDITGHVPNYLDVEIDAIAFCAAYQMIFLYRRGSNELFAYKYLWSGEDKVLSSWGKWTFDSPIVGAGTLQNKLYLVFDYEGEYHLESLVLSPGVSSEGLAYPLKLDHVQRVATGSYDADLGETTFDLDYPIEEEMGNLVVVLENDVTYDDLQVTSYDYTSGTVTVSGNYASTPVLIGYRYTMHLELSPWLPETEEGKISLQGRLQMRTVTFQISESSDFTVTVVYNGGTEGERKTLHDYHGYRLSSVNIPDAVMQNDRIRTLVMGNTRTTAVTIDHTSHFPMTFTGVSYEGFFTQRSRGG